MQPAGDILVIDDHVPTVEFLAEALADEGYTVRGVQKLLRDKSAAPEPAPATLPPVQAAAPEPDFQEPAVPAVDVFRLIAVRNRLAAAIGD